LGLLSSLVRMPASGAGGRRFKSGQPHSNYDALSLSMLDRTRVTDLSRLKKSNLNTILAFSG
jgi:hypothetical protein